MILVTGATGNVGGELVQILAAAGQPVRALSRTGRAKGLPEGVEQAVGDLNEPASLRSALTGVRGLFLYPGHKSLPQTLAQARRAGAEHVVLLSSSAAASGDTGNAVTRYMVESETAARESGLRWTILRAYGFMSNTLEWVPQLQAGDVVRAPFAGVRVAMIDPHDIAAVAAVALTTPQSGEMWTLSGPQALRPADRVRILGEVLGRDLTFDAQPDDEAQAEMSARMPAEYVAAFFDYYADGSLDESAPTPDVAGITGRPARSFRQWAQAHAAAFSAERAAP